MMTETERVDVEKRRSGVTSKAVTTSRAPDTKHFGFGRKLDEMAEKENLLDAVLSKMEQEASRPEGIESPMGALCQIIKGSLWL